VYDERTHTHTDTDTRTALKHNVSTTYNGIKR